MRHKIKIFFFLFFTCSLNSQIVVNEVSQGASGQKEYVELVVVGNVTCNAISTVDLRNYIIDDNNGNFATGAGVGIASGCVRLKNIAFWQNIPAGTIIVFYNDNDINSSIPPNDLSMADGNCRLIIPISDCTLLERISTAPNTGTSLYPFGSTFSNCGGSWNEVAMANGGDSFQTITPTGGLIHGVSWGNNNTGTLIYFAGNAGGMVQSNLNSVNNNPSNQANWVNQSVSGNETPGFPNSPANAAWINSMNNGCAALQPFGITTSYTNSNCFCSGLATISATGALAPYSFTWSPMNITTNSVSSLCQGIYTVISMSSNSCILSSTFAITNVNTLTLTAQTKSVDCFNGNNGSGTVTSLGVPGPFTYTWLPAGGSNSVATNLSAGVYSITVAAGNCIQTITLQIAQPLVPFSLSISQNSINCFGQTTGSASATNFGGTSPYSYSWVPSGSTGSSVNNLSAGTYTLNSTDATGCSASQTFQILQPNAPLNAAINSTNVLCFGGNTGSSAINVSGGTAVYNYTWLPFGGNNSIASNLTAGTYTAVVTDSKNCSLTVTTSVQQPSSGVSAVLSLTNVNCYGQANGAINVMANGGSSLYNYNWTPALSNNPFQNNLISGNYSVSISDNNGCTTSLSATINQPNQVIASINSLTLCNGANGILSASVTGGIAPFNYNWNGTISSSVSILVNPPVTTAFSLTVTDANGCLSPPTTSTIQVSTPLTVSVTPSITVCPTSSFTLSAFANGGLGNINYSWSLNAGNTPQIVISPTTSLVYTITVIDACLVPASATVNVILDYLPNSSLIANIYSGCSPLCVRFTNTATTNNSNILNSIWNFGNGTNANSISTEYCYTRAGSFTVTNTIFTASGCSLTNTLTNIITVSQTPIADFYTSGNVFSQNSANVVFQNLSSGATNYSWDFGSMGNSNLTNPIFLFSEPGNYLITLLATNGACVDTIYKIIKVEPNFTFYAPNAFTPNADDLNDTFIPLGEGWQTSNYNFEIYDRWGELIFTTDNTSVGWKGYFKGSSEPVKNDVYVWKISVKDLTGKMHYFSGHIKVIR
ncbi:MAG: gliding motility-associated C-terminal domain-containing protein [Bacteroidetes bacterium]|jgi:gliding motility-associated-like protein|nr:gliding motility-associated C-terminal domain-containing protein [Bacteroidota bacterium]MCA6444764.1 gliding motility-associated C-terminal domain-containing protein [Bacteroidota bacterium]